MLIGLQAKEEHYTPEARVAKRRRQIEQHEEEEALAAKDKPPDHAITGRKMMPF